VALLQGVPQLALAVLVEGDAEADDFEHVGLRRGGGRGGCSAGAAAEADRLQWASMIVSTVRPTARRRCRMVGLPITGRVDGRGDVVLEDAAALALELVGRRGLMKTRLASRSLRRLMAALPPPSM
jgi:hypothetical protein